MTDGLDKGREREREETSDCVVTRSELTDRH